MDTRKYTAIALLSSTVLAIRLSGADRWLRFPILTYLHFDLCEIPSFTALLLYGLPESMAVATIHFIVLMLSGEFVPIGPIMKYLAVISTLIGYWIGAKLCNKGNLPALITSCILRVIVMTGANWALLFLIEPSFLQFVVNMLNVATQINNVFLIILLAFVLTGIYNAIHVIVINYGVSMIIVRRIRELQRRS